MERFLLIEKKPVDGVVKALAASSRHVENLLQRAFQIVIHDGRLLRRLDSIKTVKNLAVCGALLAIAGVSYGQSPNVHEVEPWAPMVRNGNTSFERGKIGAMEAWSWQGDSALRVSLDTKSSATGKRAFRIERSGKAAGKSASGTLMSSPFPVRPGEYLEPVADCAMLGGPLAAEQFLLEYRCNGEWETAQKLGRNTPYQPKHFNSDDPWGSFAGLGGIVPRKVDAARFRLTVEFGANGADAVLFDDIKCKAVSFSNYVAAKTGAPKLKNLFWMAADALDQAPLGCYGGDRVQTPVYDNIARQGIRYVQVTTAASWTKPSFASLMTGLYPSQHGAEERASILPAKMKTFAEYAHDRGYFTAGFVMSARDGYLGKDMGHAQGFDVYVHATNEDDVFREIKLFLDTNAQSLSHMKGGGIFIFYHMFEPHAPYVNHTPELIVNKGVLGQRDIFVQDLGKIAAGKIKFDQRDFDYAIKLYTYEVGYLDRRLAQVMERFQWLGLYDNLNVLLNADHGEIMPRKVGSGYLYGHGRPYEECVRVPLVMRFPGRIKPGQVDDTDLVSSLDVFPTLLDLIGVPVPDYAEGRDLLDPDAKGPTQHFDISENREGGWLSIRDNTYQLIVSHANEIAKNQQDVSDRYKIHDWTLGKADCKARFYLYNIRKDFHEKHNLRKKKPEEFKRLRAVLFAHCKRVGIIGKGASARKDNLGNISNETQEQLRALGYVD